MPPLHKIENRTQGNTLATHATIADGLCERLIGLLGRASLPAGEALVFPQCWSIHTIGMRFPIDVIFIDRAWRVAVLKPAVPPGRMIWPVHAAWGVIEMAAGAIQACELIVGDQLHLTDASHTS